RLAEHAAPPRARPDPVFRVELDCPDERVHQTFSAGELLPMTVFQMVQPGAFAADPEIRFSAAADRGHRPALPMIRRGNRCYLPFTQRDHAYAAGAGPKITFSVFAKRTDPILGQTIRAIELDQFALWCDHINAVLDRGAQDRSGSRFQ